MKKLFIVCIGTTALAWGAFAQTPTMTPLASPGAPSVTPAAPTATIPAPTATAAVSITPAFSASPTASEPSSLADRIHKKFDKKLRHKGIVHIDTDGDSDTATPGHHDDVIPENVIPIIAIVMMSVFGAPVLIVSLLIYFGSSRSRMMHKTVRMMVEKGQPVPAALLNPPPHVRKRSDIRRGVVLIMIGLGISICFGALSDSKVAYGRGV